jgi:serine/threonine protein kinase
MIAGRYRVEREIGRGGMATVYLCTDIKENKQVAVKVLRAELGSAVVVERFLREIAFAQELDHPQIPKVLDSGLVGALPYYVMTYIEGHSLRAHLDKVKQLPLEEAIHITAEVAKPTAYAHARGIVHRDIKPANILLSPSGVYVLDFGVARAILASADDSLTSTGVAVGTPAYMSPEQALADDNLDSRSDIYSLGCVLYEMIAGIPPFVGATPQSVMSRRFIAPPPPLHEVRDLVPPEIEAAVMRALTKSPADRFQKVQDLADALTAPRQTPTLQTQQVRLDTRKRRNTIALIAGGIVTAAAMGGFAWSIASRDYVGRAQTSVAQWDFNGATEQLASAVKRSPDDVRAQLWLAQLKMLRGDPVNDWRRYALRAADGSASLADIDRQRAAALVAYSADDSPEPCEGFKKVAAARPAGAGEDITATLSLAECLAGDRIVVPDAKSRTGYSFRASFHQAASLFEGLLARHSTDGAAYAFIVPRLERILWTNGNRLRGGALKGAQEKEFIAWPELVSDTLSLVPVPVGGDNPLRQNVAEVDRVVARNIEKLRGLAIDWTKAAPDDPDGHETLARMLETAGNFDGPAPNALQEIRTARNAAAAAPIADGETFARNLALASTHVRLLLKVHRFDAAAAIADSAAGWKTSIPLSDSLRSASDNLVLGLASLTGRIQTVLEVQRRHAGEYVVRTPSGEPKTPPLEVAIDARNLESYADFGGPRDSIVKVVERLTQNITAVFPPGQVNDIRTFVLTRPLGRAAPSIGVLPNLGLGPTNDMFPNALAALEAHDLRRARMYADRMGALYAERAPGEVTMDAVLQYAWLRAQVGDSTTAARFLDDALRGLSRAPATMLQSAHIPAALVRAMILRSQLAKKAGDAELAAAWERSARQLWSKADPMVAELLRAM